MLAMPRSKRSLVAIDVEQALAHAVVFDAGLGDELLQRLLRIDAELELPQRVAARALGGAVAQELQAPGPQARIGAELQAQRLVVLEQRLQQDLRRARRGPGQRVAGRDEPGIGVARLIRRDRLPVDDDDLVAFPGELPGGRHPDDAAAEDHRAHGRPPAKLAKAGPKLNRPCICAVLLTQGQPLRCNGRQRGSGAEQRHTRVLDTLRR